MHHVPSAAASAALMPAHMRADDHNHLRWLAIEDAISEQGWSLVLLLRAAPFVPCCVLNYTLSLTSVRFNLHHPRGGCT